MTSPAETQDIIQLLREHYPFEPAPRPNATLAARMDAGIVGARAQLTTDELAERRRRRAAATRVLAGIRPRLRYAAAAVAAMFVATSGLAAAGALPRPLQREIAAIVSHVGIDLPTPDSTPSPHRTPPPSRPSVPSGRSPGAGSGPPDPPMTPAGGSPNGPTPTSPAAGLPPAVQVPGSDVVPSTALPPVPPVPSAPGVTLPVPLPPPPEPPTTPTLPKVTVPPPPGV
jgi:hypothetical protein